MKSFPKVTTAVAGVMLLAVALWAAVKYGLTRSLFSSDFLAHRYCYLGDPSLIWTNALSDCLIWLAYTGIAIGLALLLRKTQSLLGFRWVFVSFGLFIVACGFTHFFEMVTVWMPLYWLATSVKVLTAAASVATAIAFVPKVTRAAEAIRLFHKAYSESEEKRVRTLSKLLDWEERMKLASETSGFATWERSLITGELHWDERCRAIFGVPPGVKLHYQDFLKRIHPEERAAMQMLIESSIEKRGEYDATFRIVRDDGEVRTVISRGKSFPDEDGLPVRLVGILIDITRERQAQEALIRTEKLAAAGRMAASIAHEVNNPLEAATGLLYISRSDSRVPGEVKEYLSMAEEELQRAAKITRSTLSFYRESPTPTGVNLTELVSSVLEFQQPRIKKSGVTVRKKFEGQAQITAFPGELRQIFTNLIANAVDAMSGGGELVVSIHGAADWRTSKHGYVVTIADNGTGIPEPARRKLFEAFYSTKGDKGTGLGLWICKQLVEKNGGSIRFRSCAIAESDRHGTTFTVWLPVTVEGNNNGRK